MEIWARNEQDNSMWYRKNKKSKIWWLYEPDYIGRFVFSFDMKNQINLFQDYPHGLTVEQKEIFDKENPHWKKFFRDR